MTKRSPKWGKEGPQRGYRSSCGCVHFYPSRCWRICNANYRNRWIDDRKAPKDECASMFAWEQDFKPENRLTTADTLSVWATRPRYMRAPKG